MKRAVLVLGFIAAILILGLAMNGYLGSGITGQASQLGVPFDMNKSIQVGVVLLASLGILTITLVNIFHKD